MTPAQQLTQAAQLIREALGHRLVESIQAEDVFPGPFADVTGVNLAEALERRAVELNHGKPVAEPAEAA